MPASLTIQQNLEGNKCRTAVAILRLVTRQKTVVDLFISYLLERNKRIKEDLADQLFISSEKRLIQTVFLLARYY
jgi:hypothetical protein